MIRVERGTRHEPPVDPERRERPVEAVVSRALSRGEVRRMAEHDVLSGEASRIAYGIERWALGTHPAMADMTPEQRGDTRIAAALALSDYAVRLERRAAGVRQTAAYLADVLTELEAVQHHDGEAASTTRLIERGQTLLRELEG